MEDFHRPPLSDSFEVLPPTREVSPSQAIIYGRYDPRPRSMKGNRNWSMIVVWHAKSQSGMPLHAGAAIGAIMV
jgi:hypothetical protein